MKLFYFFTIFGLFYLLSSCEQENLPPSEEKLFESEVLSEKIKPDLNFQKSCSTNFSLRIKPYSPSCDDNQNDPTYDFEIVFENPTTEDVELLFSIKKNPTLQYSLLAAGINDVFIPAGTTIKTVTTSCELPYLINCQNNGTVSQNFYIEFVQADSLSDCVYTTNDNLIITAHKICFGMEDPDPPKGGGF